MTMAMMAATLQGVLYWLWQCFDDVDGHHDNVSTTTVTRRVVTASVTTAMLRGVLHLSCSASTASTAMTMLRPPWRRGVS